jgi:hypothetical protein
MKNYTLRLASLRTKSAHTHRNLAEFTFFSNKQKRKNYSISPLHIAPKPTQFKRGYATYRQLHYDFVVTKRS